jgi:Ca-activated chloride channel family protein
MTRRPQVARLIAVALVAVALHACTRNLGETAYARKPATVSEPAPVAQRETDPGRDASAPTMAMDQIRRIAPSASEMPGRALGVAPRGEAGFSGGRPRQDLGQPNRLAPSRSDYERRQPVERQADAKVALPRLAGGEELWVIARAEWDGTTPAPPPEPVFGGLEAKRGEQQIPLPLEHTDVRASVAGYIASVRVQQRYTNPYAEKIEALYVFPLPPDAAVSDFVMTVGSRRIRGVIRERQQAEQLYVEARAQGYVASLLTQERPNIFTQAVANIEPGKRIDVDLTYYNPLAYHDGEYEFVFPMVVGPRFNPPGSRDGIGAVPAGQYGSSGQPNEVHYLPPDKRSGHDIAVQVDIDAGMPIEALGSPTHVIDSKAPSPARRTVTLHPSDTVPNKDFVLRYRLAGGAVKTAFLGHRDQRGGFFTLMLEPPADLAAAPRAPMELVFVLDCSGSMSGAPLQIAKQAADRALRRLGPDDTFQIVQFSTNASQLGPRPLPATDENLAIGLSYLHSLQSEGGTMMIEGIKAALDFPHDPRRLRVVSLMTDGFIGNEEQILGEMQRRIGAARVFSFGIGSSTNRYLLDRMAMLGRGAVAYVGLDEGSQRAVDQFYERVSHPALTDLSIDWGGLTVSEVYPSRLPDLFVGRPVMISGRYEGDGPATVRITGRAGGESQTIAVAVDGAGDATRPALASVWARTKIADLEDRATIEGGTEVQPQITQVALDYNLMSAYTAFVAVDSSQRTAGSHGTTVAVPVPVPDGVRYDTTVPEPQAAAR